MKQFLIFLIATSSYNFSFAQAQKVKGNISSADTATLVILNVFPDSFPNISVVFKAETKSGEPVWNLTKEKMKAKENNQECTVISLEQISKNKPLNLGVVIDHSGSMMGHNYIGSSTDGKRYFYINGQVTEVSSGNLLDHTPLGDAKIAVKKFIKTFNAQKDYISIIGFSEKVDTIVPLTQNIATVNNVVDSMQPTSVTALYDAMIAGLNEIKKAKGVQVLVTLTDGMDNASSVTYQDVIDHAKKLDIPVYIVGLGDVNKDTLRLIATATNGQFYYTETSGSLETVYAKISKQVQAFYNLVYASTNFSSADSTRLISLSFDVDSIYLDTHSFSKNFPSEVVAYVAAKKREREYMLYGSIAVVALIGAGTLLYYRKRKQRNNTVPVINKIFPNPSSGLINVDYISNGGELFITSLNGNTVKTISLAGSGKQFDLSVLPKGNYIAQIHAGSQQSNPVQFIIE